MPEENNNSITLDTNTAITICNPATFADSDTVVTIRKGDMLADISSSILGIYAAGKIIDKVSPVLNKTLCFLLRNRDFLGHQLNHKMGNLTDEEFETLVQEYLPPTIKYNLNELKSEIKLLMDISALTFDADQLSVMFNCEIDDAEQILTAIVKHNING